MEDAVRLGGIVLVCIAVYWHSTVMHKARLNLTDAQLVVLQRALGPSVVGYLGPTIPFVIVYLLVSVIPHYAVEMFLIAAALSVSALVMLGAHNLRRARVAGMPENYLVTYRRSHNALLVAFILGGAALAYPIFA